jgi:hypothetical protein
MDYTNFIRKCLEHNLPLDEMMKEEISFLLLTFNHDKAIDIIVNDFIPSLHHEANDLRMEYLS